MFLNENKENKTIYTLVNDYSVKTAFALFKSIYNATDAEDKDEDISNTNLNYPCLEDLNDIGIVYKNVLYNLSELSKVAIDEIFITMVSCKKRYKGNKLLRNTIEEFHCEGV